MGTNNGKFGMKVVKAIVIALVFGLVAGGTFAGVNLAINKISGNSTKNYGENVIEGTAVSTATAVSDVSDIANNVLPSVVSVTNVSLTQYRTLFGTSVQQTPSAGTGIIFSQDSDYLYIVTNNHVIENSNSLTVTFCNDTAVDATIVGTSEADDVAVICVKLSDVNEETQSLIKVCVIGDSNELVVGDGAIIIGNALGYGQSVTTGVISALNRKISATDSSGRSITNTVIQTDAAVNPGNSGGPLLNMKGEMVGIVSAKLSNTSVEGMGYAIPSSTVTAIINEIMNSKDGNASSNSEQSSGGAYLGIAGMDISQSTAKQYGISTGVYITKVYTGGAAEKAGLSQGDVITGFDDTTITSMSQIKNILATHNAGDKVKITIDKGGSKAKSTQLEITLGSQSGLQ
ncbi:MAG: trypsin-like peptidase domain-containing protein [Lachnospiraceae bacterium]|nr:trypsin-like peptidase domain-containing protein [Lachnospiraceae bacterium]